GVRALADSVLLEFGESRQQDLASRSRILQWQPQLRTIFLTRITLWKYRIQLPGFQLPLGVSTAQQAFDEQSANLLDRVADRMEGKDAVQQGDLEESFDRLEQAIQNAPPEHQKMLSPELRTFMLLSRRTQSLMISLNNSTEPNG